MSGSNSLMAAAMTSQGIMSMGSAYAQSSAYSMQGDFQKSMYKMNADIADIEAADAMKRGERAASAQKKQVKQLIGTQRASLAAQGIDIESGSALDIQTETAQMGELDRIMIKNNAWREAWGYRMEAVRNTATGKYAGNVADFRSNMTLLTGGLNALNYGMSSAYYWSKGKTNTTPNEIDPKTYEA